MSHTFMVSRPLRESSVWLGVLDHEATVAGYGVFALVERDIDGDSIECTITDQVPA